MLWLSTYRYSQIISMLCQSRMFLLILFITVSFKCLSLTIAFWFLFASCFTCWLNKTENFNLWLNNVIMYWDIQSQACYHKDTATEILCVVLYLIFFLTKLFLKCIGWKPHLMSSMGFFYAIKVLWALLNHWWLMASEMIEIEMDIYYLATFFFCSNFFSLTCHLGSYSICTIHFLFS